MALQSDRPYVSANFLVDLGDGAQGAAAGFAEVVFPVFAVAADPRRADDAHGSATTGERLILKRGVTGALNVYAWWHKARNGKPPQRRTVQVHLLAEDHATVVFSWRFRHARPVSLTYSPLHALDGGVLIETLEVEFERVEIA